MAKLITVRHGQSTWNAENRFTGWVDVDLSKTGIEEAEQSGKLIKDLKIEIDFFYSSYLIRSIKTLEIILNILGKKDKTVKAWELNERHYGELTGLNKAEIKNKIGDQKFKEYRRSWDVSPPPLKKNSEFSSHNNDKYKKLKKIPDTESLKDTYNRVIPFFEQNIKSKLDDGKNIIISAHGNTIRALAKKVFNISNKNINQLEIPTGNPLVIEFNSSGTIEQAEYLDQTRKKEIIMNI